MIYAIMSDVHANIDALEKVLERIDSLGVKTIVCLGDVVGYNATPNECVNVLAERDIQTILGNHDAVACGLEEPWGFNPVALTAAIWTREQLSDEAGEWLYSLPDSLNYGQFCCVHGAPKNHNVYLFAWEDTLPHKYFLEEQNCNICFMGHTHMPVVFAEEGPVPMSGKNRFELDPGKPYFINPGSVGQPRDENPAASFGLLNTDDLSYELVRVPYDAERASKRVRDAELPPFLAERLVLGR